MDLAISSVDATIVALYLLAMVAFGYWIGRGQKNISGYLLGNRDLPWWAILGSIVATETSTATFLSVPGLTYAAEGDMRFLQLAIGFILGRLVVAGLFVPRYFKGSLFTAYDLFEKRFGDASKKAASVLFLLTRNLGDGLRLFLAAIALEKVLGIDLYLCIVVIGITTIIYTFFGGMKAVIWSDCIQFVVYMTGGIVALMLLISALPGGMEQLLDFGRSSGRFHLFDFRISDDSGGLFLLTETYSFWAGVIGGAVLTLGTHGTDQMMVQRYLCASNQRDAGRALVLSGLVVFLQFTLFLILGIALAAYYTLVQPQTFDRADEVFAAYIVDQLPIGLIGLTLAAVFSAAMSTLSSSLNSSATSLLNDIYAPIKRATGAVVSDDRMLGLSKWFTVAFGIIQVIIAIVASKLSASVVSDALAIAGFTAGILLGVFVLGTAFPRANQSGVLSGMLTGVVVLTIVKFATSVAWTWFAVIGAITTIVVGYLASLMFSGDDRDPFPASDAPPES